MLERVLSDERLDQDQIAWLGRALGDHQVVADLSWGTTPSWVWLVQDGTGDSYVVKAAAAAMRHHAAREIDAHEQIVPALAASDDAQRFVAGSRELGIFVVSHLPGELAGRTAAATDPATFRQAGALLARIHGHGSRTDADYERARTDKARHWLTTPHRIPADRVAEIDAALRRHAPRPVTVVPTHGDWQPRNWVVETPPGRVRVIDFGRFAWRPAQTDLVRCWSQEWRARPDLAAAHHDGYGDDPRDETWPMECLRQAVSTAAWAYQMNDEPFEQHGLEMIDRALRLVSDGTVDRPAEVNGPAEINGAAE